MADVKEVLMKLSAPDFLEMWLEGLAPTELSGSDIAQMFMADATHAGFSEDTFRGIVGADLATYLAEH